MHRHISFVVLWLASASALSAEGLSATQPSTPIWVWVCVGAAAGVFFAIGYSVVAYKKSSTPGAVAGQEQARPARELLWASVPIAIVIAAATPSLTNTTAHLSAMSQTAPAEVCSESPKIFQPSSLPTATTERKIPVSTCTALR